MEEQKRIHMTEPELDRYAATAPDLVAYTRQLRALLGQAYEFIELGSKEALPLDVQWEVHSDRWEARQRPLG